MPATADPDDSAAPTVPRSLWVVVVVLALQALAFVALAVVVLVKTATAGPHSLAGALLDAVLALAGAAVLGGCARSLLNLRPAARTPVVVIELLAVPVSYTLTFPAHRVEFGAPILISALAVLYLLFTPAARLALDRER